MHASAARAHASATSFKPGSLTRSFEGRVAQGHCLAKRGLQQRGRRPVSHRLRGPCSAGRTHCGCASTASRQRRLQQHVPAASRGPPVMQCRQVCAPATLTPPPATNALAGDAATGQLQQWGVGASWTRLVTGDDMPATPDNAAASASSLSGQQVRRRACMLCTGRAGCCCMWPAPSADAAAEVVHVLCPALFATGPIHSGACCSTTLAALAAP